MDDISIYNHAKETQQGMLNEAMWKHQLRKPMASVPNSPRSWWFREKFANFLIDWGMYLKQAESLTAVSSPTITHPTHQ